MKARAWTTFVLAGVLTIGPTTPLPAGDIPTEPLGGKPPADTKGSLWSPSLHHPHLPLRGQIPAPAPT
jgi:hypothetical protein